MSSINFWVRVNTRLYELRDIPVARFYSLKIVCLVCEIGRLVGRSILSFAKVRIAAAARGLCPEAQTVRVFHDAG